MNTYAVVLTYKNRFNLLKQVINSLLTQKIKKIIVVDNGSDLESQNKLKELELKLKEKIKVIYLGENTGSANGYKRGLQEAYNSEDCDFIWLLDDDNMPEANALEVLTDFWNNFNDSNKEEHICLFSNRDSYSNLVEIAKKSLGTEELIGGKNYFLGFHIKNLFVEINKRLFNRSKKQSDSKKLLEPNKSYGEIPLGAYGGMFFNRKIIDKIGYPDENYFVYLDDFEYFSRVIKIGGIIFLLYESKIIDLDKHQNSYKKSPSSAYYIYRNTVYFQKNYNSPNKILFFINYILYSISLNLGLKENSFNILAKAISDGYNNRMGKNESF